MKTKLLLSALAIAFTMGISAQDATTTTKSRQNVKAKEKTEQTDNTRKQPVVQEK